MSFFAELRRRNVFRVGIAYLVTAWLVAQIADVVLGVIGSPDWVMRTLVLVLALGFPFAVIFAWAFELTPEGIKREKDVDRAQSITHRTGRKLDFTIIGVLTIALAYFAIDKFVWQPSGAESVSGSPNAAAVEGQGETHSAASSIAVLPFVNMSEDASNEYFSDGISEEILNALARVRDLKVAGRTSSFAFKGQNQDLRQIGEALGVEHILEGSVRKYGNQIRITAQLIKVDDGFHLWSDTYDRELTDVFAIQDEISTAILAELKTRLIEGGAEEVAAARTSTEAYDLYLLAKQRMYERTGPTIESARELLDRAIAIDPGYAPAHAQRAIATLLLSEGAGTYGDIPQDRVIADAGRSIDRALEIDPELDEAWAARGLWHLQQPTGLRAGTTALEKALSINPGLIDASNWLHNTYMALGRPDEARRIIVGMAERDPLYRPGVRNVVNAYILFGEPERALAHLDRVRPLIPNDATLLSSEGAVRQAMGQKAEATRLIDRAVELQPSNSVARLTQTFAWLDTHQNERAAEDGYDFPRILGLVRVGRTEEATLLAYRRAEEIADVPTLFNVLNLTSRSPELVAYLEERWDTLESLERDFPPYGAFGHFMMLDAALAYSRAGNQARFDEALERVRDHHDRLIAMGVKNGVFFINEACHQALAGDLEASLGWLERAIDNGMVTSLRIADEWPWLEPLEGDPRYEAIQARMIEHLNDERAQLGLEPVST
ncbi:tetratricopeptide repeat protein [Elongatibacter sediminis]|uniref:Tetratricopeptide repeat protein n=1 Tax=Elongatibacter sediminis TaxID=3119006 RepID=A0AAW9RJH8_9GAMM